MMPIPLIDENDQLIEAELEDALFYLGMSWNEEGGFWTLSIRNLDQEIMVAGIKVVATWPLLMQVRRQGFPPGELFVDAAAGEILDRRCFFDGRAALFYMTRSELA